MPQVSATDDRSLKEGLERHLAPAGNDADIVTRASSDRMFGPEGMGLGRTPFTTVISWLARNGITEQTKSNPNETDIANCVLGWGQGGFSSRVFLAGGGSDEPQLGRLTERLLAIAEELGRPGRIDDAVLAAFVGSQRSRPFLAWDGVREFKDARSRIGGRFRAHIQWQAIYHLCGQIGTDGIKRVTPQMLEQFFTSREPFFEQFMERRRLLKERNLTPGASDGPLCDIMEGIDRERTDWEIMRNKSGARMLAKIAFYMLTRKRTRLGPFSTDAPLAAPDLSCPDSASRLPSAPTRQYELLVVALVKDGEVDALRRLLGRVRNETIEAMQGRPTGGELIPFHRLVTLHFARFVVIDAYEGEPAYLAFASNFDGLEGDDADDETGARERYLDELVGVARPGLDQILRHCEGYSDGFTSAQMRAYIGDNGRRVRAQTFYNGSSGRSLGQILVEWKLRRDVDAAADRVSHDVRKRGPMAIRDAIRSDLRARGIEPQPFPAQPSYRLRFALIAVGAALALGLLGVFAPGLLALLAAAVLGWWVVLRFKERSDPVEQPQHTAETTAHTQYSSHDENLFLQNQLTHLVERKEGLFRAFTIRLVFAALQFLATYHFNKGKLGGIPSIHFARWAFIGSRRRVLFFSNFDNSWQSYLGDFIDHASTGLTAVWSNTKGYPRSKNLVFAGSRNATSFLAVTRANQLPTDVWYSAYPGLTVRNVNANTEIRRGLADDEALSARDWLRLLGGVDLASLGPAGELESPSRQQSEALPHDDIQGIILRGYGGLGSARYLMLKVDDPSDAEAVRGARRWLAELPITSVSRSAKDQQAIAKESGVAFVNVAFSHPGLRALGCDSTLLGGFPAEFVEGSHSEARSRILGDFDDSSPENWRWGSGAKVAHVLLLVYCGSDDWRERESARYKGEAAAHGLSLIDQVDGNTLPGRKEHFGFRDGIAQPLVRGGVKQEQPYNTLAPGEFLLGYGDGYRSEADPDGANIAFAPKAAAGFEFGKAGSYLVFRQLEQDVRAFWEYCERMGQSLDSKLPAVAIASKMVGRWPNGLPLVVEPETPPGEEESNEDRFAYLVPGRRNDAYGERCPFGAHIRRTNPRDWELGADRIESIGLANLHRIIRRGRPYGPAFTSGLTESEMLAKISGREPDKDARGLAFICFNGNIERQFEFVQQQWANNPQFAGMAGDSDPIVGSMTAPGGGRGTADPTFTIQRDPLRIRLSGMSRFVKVIGSGYFFMPSLRAVRHLGEQ